MRQEWRPLTAIFSKIVCKTVALLFDSEAPTKSIFLEVKEMFMQSLESHLNECNNRSVTENGAVGYKSTGKALLDLNFLTSSLRSANEQTIISKFDAAFQENPELALKWLFFARDIRGGMGERRLFRVILRHLVDQCYMVVKPFLKLVPEYGRWDDLWCLLDSKANKCVAGIIREQLAQDMEHSLNAYKAECRTVLQYAKGIEFGSEDEFDLTYKSLPELIEMFRKQDAIPEKEWMEAIENTNRMADSVEEFDLDVSFKYPKLYGDSEADKKMLLQTERQLYTEKREKGIIPDSQAQAFIDAMQEENRVFEKVDMMGFMLFMSEMVRWAKSHDIPIGFNRGSCGGSRVAYVTDIIDLNPEQWHTVFSRFCNEDRKEIGDIDIDVAPDDRDKIYQYIINRFGSNKTAYILAIGTISEKGTIDEIGRALANIWEKDRCVAGRRGRNVPQCCTEPSRFWLFGKRTRHLAEALKNFGGRIGERNIFLLSKG